MAEPVDKEGLWMSRAMDEMGLRLEAEAEIARLRAALEAAEMAACERAVTDQFAALQSHYPAMEARCVETAVLWESPIPRRKP